MVLVPGQHISAVPIFFVVFRKKLSQQRKGNHFLAGNEHHPIYQGCLIQVQEIFSGVHHQFLQCNAVS
jgi:hypothetical protein